MAGERNHNLTSLFESGLGNALCTRCVSELLLSDGATSKRCEEVTVGAPGNVSGLSTTFVGLIPPIPANPGSNIFLFYLGPNGSASLGSSDDYALVCFIGTSGQLILSQRGASGGYRLRNLSNYVSTYGKNWQVLMISFPTGDSTTDPIIWLAGADRFAETTPASSGSVPNWMPTTLQPTKWVTGFEWRTGFMPRFIYGPGVWTSTEALVFAQTGLTPAWWNMTTGKVAARSSDFSAGTDNFTTNASGVTGNQDGISDGVTSKDDVLVIFANATNTPDHFANSGAITGYSNLRRLKVRIRFEYLIPVGNTNVNRLRLTTQTSGGGFDSELTSLSTVGTWSAYNAQHDFTSRSDVASSLRFYAFKNAGDSFAGINASTDDRVYIKNLKIDIEGPALELEYDPNLALRDRKANQLHGVRTTGTSYAGEKVDSLMVSKVSHGGSGNLQFAGGAIFDSGKGWVIESLLVRSTAAVTWSFGSASGGAQYVSGYSLAVGGNYIPAASLVTRLIGTANLWSNSNGAADITITLNLRRTY